MSEFIDSLRTKNTYTANGALSNGTSLNACLDLFSVIGCHNDYSDLFWTAFASNPDLAMKILFWSRDCRGGAGARKTFIEVMKTMQFKYPETFKKTFKYIPVFGYWKDIFNLEPCESLIGFIGDTISNDMDHSLCCKYMPRKGKWFYEVRAYLGMSPAEFRHFIVNKTNVVETQMCKNEWDGIEYDKVPSVAGLRYKSTFIKHDKEGYNDYITKVLSGEKKINSDVLYPHDIYRKYERNKENPDAYRAMWDNLPDYMYGCTDRILPVCDVSGSMTCADGIPMDVSVALGCYISERNHGPFKNAFITFSGEPTLNYLEGNIIQRFEQLRRADWGMNTNLQAVFDLILEQALRHNLENEDMPTKILIISDMQFDIAVNSRRRRVLRRVSSAVSHYVWEDSRNDCTNLEVIKQKYEEAGYDVPEIVFWNVNGSAGEVPATMKDENIALVSGYSPSILTNLLKGKILSPMQIMIDTVCTPRYECITA